MLEKYTITKVVDALVQKNKENFKLKNTSQDDSSCDNELTGFDNGILILFLIIYIILIGWAIYALIKNWDKLENWAKVFALLALVNNNFGGPAASLIIIYVSQYKPKTSPNIENLLEKKV